MYLWTLLWWLFTCYLENKTGSYIVPLKQSSSNNSAITRLKSSITITRSRALQHMSWKPWFYLMSVSHPLYSSIFFFFLQLFLMATVSHLGILLLLPFFLTVSLAANEDLLITTKDGQVQGKALSVLGGEVRAFLGIPYGKPPVGNLRFRAPQPVDKWEGVKDATRFPNTCYQTPDTAYPGRKRVQKYGGFRGYRKTEKTEIILNQLFKIGECG